MASVPITTVPECDEWIGEVDAIGDQVTHLCSQLGKMLHTRRLDASGLLEAQTHALASLDALRTVAANSHPRAPQPRATRPQGLPGSLAQQLGSLRVAVVQVVDLVEHMPGIDRHLIAQRRQLVTTLLGVIEAEARKHQPTKARE
jgi:hypothetical protein